MSHADELVDSVKRFLEDGPGLLSEGEDAEKRFAALVAFQNRLHAHGLAVPAWPVEYGGRGLGARDAATISSTLGRFGAPELVNFVGIDVLAPALLKFGRVADLLRWLPPMASADEIWCQMFSEPDAGSDLTSLRTRATLRSDGCWEVTGQKVWSTWAHYADYGLLLARTGAPDSRHRGITAFVVDMHTPGIDVRPLVTMTGEAEFAEVYLDAACVPPDAVLGEVNGGWDVAQVILTAERGPYAVRRAAVLARALAQTLRQAAERPIDGSTRQDLARAYTGYWLLEARIRRIVEDLDEGRTPGFDSALTKLLMSECEQALSAARLSLLGCGGTAWTDAETRASVEEYLYSRAASIYGGTSQIQKNIIGERLLGLPREPGSAAPRVEAVTPPTKTTTHATREAV